MMLLKKIFQNVHSVFCNISLCTVFYYCQISSDTSVFLNLTEWVDISWWHIFIYGTYWCPSVFTVYLSLICSILTLSFHHDSAQKSHCAPVGPDGCWYMQWNMLLGHHRGLLSYTSQSKFPLSATTWLFETQIKYCWKSFC